MREDKAMTRKDSSSSRLAPTVSKNWTKFVKWSLRNGVSYHENIVNEYCISIFALITYDHKETIKHFENFASILFIIVLQADFKNVDHGWDKFFKCSLCAKHIEYIKLCRVNAVAYSLCFAYPQGQCIPPSFQGHYPDD